jgi:NADPH2:quinone reductase
VRAVELQRFEGPEALAVVERPEPAATDRVLIDVYAAGVSYADLLQTKGAYQDRYELPFVLGLEVAGVVRAAPGAARVSPGDRVCAAMPYGAFAEVAVAPPSSVFPLSEQLDFAEGAGFAVNYQTAHLALVRRGRLREGERVLVQGATGGVGTAALQLAKALGARTIGVVGAAAREEVAREAGADEVVVADEGWGERVRALTGGRGVDLVVDPVGGDRFDESIRCLAAEGRLLVLGFVGGSIPSVGVNRLLFRNVDVVGVGWGPLVARAPEVAAEIDEPLRALADAGLIRPLIRQRYPLEQAAEALRDLERRRAVAKSVLLVREGEA